MNCIVCGTKVDVCWQTDKEGQKTLRYSDGRDDIPFHGVEYDFDSKEESPIFVFCSEKCCNSWSR